MWYIPLRRDVSFVTKCYSISRCTKTFMSSDNLAHYSFLKTRIYMLVGCTRLIPGSSWPADFHILWKFICEEFVCSVPGAFLHRSTRNIVITWIWKIVSWFILFSLDLNAISFNFDFWVTLAENEAGWRKLAPQWGLNSTFTVIKSSWTSFGRIIPRSKTHRVISLSRTSARVFLAPFGLANGYRVSDLESASLIPLKGENEFLIENLKTSEFRRSKLKPIALRLIITHVGIMISQNCLMGPFIASLWII